MATTEIKLCDVYGRPSSPQAPVRSYRVEVRQVCPNNHEVAVEGIPPSMDRVIDLCPRALRRLTRMIGRGLVPPTKATGRMTDEGDTGGPFDQNPPAKRK